MKYATSLLNKSAYSTNIKLDNQSIEWWFAVVVQHDRNRKTIFGIQSIEWWFAVQGVEQAGGIEQGKNVGLVFLMDGWLIWGSSN